MVQKIKRICYDIETAPNIGEFWEPGYNITITPEQILAERQIICISYKEEGKRVKHLEWQQPKDLSEYIFGDNEHDKQMIKEFLEIIDDADEIVAHNGNRFDLKWIKGRAIRLGLKIPPDIITVDTCLVARQQLNCNSNKLDYLAKFLGVGGKIATGGYGLWKAVIRGDEKAMKKMIRYCDNDVVILEKVFNKLKPLIKNKLSVSNNRRECAECGNRMKIHSHKILASGAKRTVLECGRCGKCKVVPTSVIKDN